MIPTTKHKKLEIFVDFERGSIFEYEDPGTRAKGSYKAHDKINKTWRHLNFFEHECHLKASAPRIKPKDGDIKMIFPPWTGKVYGFTLLFEALVLQMCLNMPVRNVAKILRTSDHKLWHVPECHVDMGLSQADYKAVNAVGMDETSLKRGHIVC